MSQYISVRRSRIYTAATCLFLLVVLWGLPACGIVSTSEDGNITLVNATNETIYYAIFEAASLPLIDPIPQFSPDHAPFPSVQPGDMRRVEQRDSYRESEDIAFFLYAVREVSDEVDKRRLGVMVGTLVVTADEIDQNNGRVVIETLR